MENKYIKINEDYYLSADELNYTLIQKKVTPKREFQTKKILDGYNTSYNEIGYFPTFGALLYECANRMAREAIMNGKVTTLTECTEFISTTCDDLKAFHDSKITELKIC